MQLGIFAKTFSGNTPEQVLESVAKSGFCAAHYNWACSGLASMPDAIPAATAAHVASVSRAKQVDIIGLSATWNMAHPDPVIREKGLISFDVSAAQAKFIGTQLVTLCTGTRDPDDQWRHHPDNQSADAWRDLLASMRQAVVIADRHDLVLGIEPELANIVNSVAAAERLFSEIGSQRLKLVLDPANLFEMAAPNDVRRLVEDAVAKLGTRIAMAHAKDRDTSGQFVAAGMGMIDFDHFIGALKQIRFSGPLVTHGLTVDEAPKTYDILHGLLVKHGCAE